MKTRGFSLMEILVVLLVLGIVLSLSAVMLGGYIDRLRLSQAAQETAAQLRSLSGKALNQSQLIQVELSAGSRTLKWGNPQQSFTLPNNAVIASVKPTPPGGVLEFNGRGFLTDEYYLTIKRGSLQRTITVLVTGKVVMP